MRRPANFKKIEIPQTYEDNLDEAEIVGIILGDGYIYKNNLVRLKVRELDFCQHFAKLIAKTYGLFAPIKLKKYPTCFVHSTNLAERLINLTRNNKEIPDFILKGDKFIKARFIRGFSDAEGSVDVIYNRRQIVITQNNVSLLKQIKQLLLDIGIQSKVVIKKFGSAKLIISLLRNLELYQEYIGFAISYKRKKLSEAIAYLRNCKAHDSEKYWDVLRHYLHSGKSLRGSAKELGMHWETYRSWIYGMKTPCQIKKNIEYGWVPEDYEDLREQYDFLPLISFQ